MSLCSDGKRKLLFIHRLVAQAFVPNLALLPEVNHKDANKRNNLFSNLEWVTRKQNANHAKQLGLYRHEPARGENHPDAKLTDEDVLCIRAQYKAGMSQADLRHWFSLSKSAMSNVCRGETWTHLPL